MDNLKSYLVPHWLTGVIVASGYIIGVMLNYLSIYLQGNYHYYMFTRGWLIDEIQITLVVIILTFFVSGYIGKFFWNHNWFKIISLIVALTIIWIEITSIPGKGIPHIVWYILIPLIYVLMLFLSFDKSNFYWFRGMTLGLILSSLPFYFGALNPGPDTASFWVVIYFIPSIVIGTSLGAIIGIIYGKIKKQ